ncbi:hypothetical protein TNCV_1947881 [Trichonephila clavipes]|nr:hypothetical protein TNCV_1947881 [Trichonephila clavipes]
MLFGVNETMGKPPAELFLVRKLITPFQKLVRISDGTEFAVGEKGTGFKKDQGERHSGKASNRRPLVRSSPGSWTGPNSTALFLCSENANQPGVKKLRLPPPEQGEPSPSTRTREPSLIPLVRKRKPIGRRKINFRSLEMRATLRRKAGKVKTNNKKPSKKLKKETCQFVIRKRSYFLKLFY